MPSIKTILKNLDRKIINAGTTSIGQFTFEDDELVKAGIPFHVYYTKNKQELFYTGADYFDASVPIIRIKGDSTFSQYKKSKSGILDSTIILKSSSTKIKKKDYTIGFVKRYFARQANDGNATIFEISKANFKKKTPYYAKRGINWQITGSRDKVAENNLREIIRLRGFFDTLLFSQWVMQYWQPPSISKKEEVLAKLRA